jgi:hypothetical protein
VFVCLFVTTAFLPWSFAQSPAQKPQSGDQRAALKVFQLYARFEEKQDYSHIYDLISSRYREELRREEKVESAKDYERLRLSSEAQWSQFRVVKIDDQDAAGFRFLVESRVEESGVVETDSHFYYLVMDRGRWKIDRWVLVSAGSPVTDK